MTARHASVSFSLLLPPQWFTVPLTDRPERDRAVRALVDRQVGRADSDAGRRRKARELLGGVAEWAAGAHGTHLCLWLDDPGDGPVTASLRISVVPVHQVAGSPRGIVLLLADGLAEPGVRQDVVDLPLGPALRRRCAVSRPTAVLPGDRHPRGGPAGERAHGDEPGGHEPGGDWLDGAWLDGGWLDGGWPDGGWPDGGWPDGGWPDGGWPDGGWLDEDRLTEERPGADQAHGADGGDVPLGWDLLPGRARGAVGDPLLGTTVLEYVVPVPRSRAVVVFAFATPSGGLAEPLVGLFDVIASTLRWEPTAGT